MHPARRPGTARRGGILFKLLAGLAVLFALGALAWMLFLPSLLTAQLRQRTGFDATVQSLTVNPFTGKVALRGLLVTNPPTFPVRDFVEVREFRADAEVFSLLGDHPVIDSMLVDVAGVTLVRREDGQSNLGAFEDHLAAPADGPPRPPSSRPPLHYLIRRLEVRFDKLVIADHSGRRPSTQEYHLGLDQTYTDVTSVKQLFVPATLQSLAPVGAALNGLLPGDLGRALNDALGGAFKGAKSGASFLKDLGRKAEQKAKGFFDALEESKKP